MTMVDVTTRRVIGVLLVLILGAAACGGDDGGSGAADTTLASDTTTKGKEDDRTAVTSVLEPETVEVGSTVWFAGFEITVESASIVPADGTDVLDDRVDVELALENLGDVTTTLDATFVLTSSGSSYEAFESDLPSVPGAARGVGSVRFAVDDDVTFDDAVITIGRPTNNQAVVPLDGTDGLVTLEPVDPGITTSGTGGELQADVTAGELRWDIPESHRQVEDGSAALTLTINITYLGDFPGGYAFGPNNLALRLPDGTTIAREDGPIELIRAGTTVRDATFLFIIDSPSEGEYAVVITDDAGGGVARGDAPFTIE